MLVKLAVRPLNASVEHLTAKMFGVLGVKKKLNTL
jgi:hypothetical protein